MKVQLERHPLTILALGMTLGFWMAVFVLPQSPTSNVSVTSDATSECTVERYSHYNCDAGHTHSELWLRSSSGEVRRIQFRENRAPRKKESDKHEDPTAEAAQVAAL